MKNWLNFCAYFLSALCLFACSAKDISYNYPQNPDYVAKSRAQKLFSRADLVIFGKTQDKDFDGQDLEDSALWHSAKEILAAEGEISVADVDGGLLMTHWRQDENDLSLRLKISANIKGAKIAAQNVEIIILRQQKMAHLNKTIEWKNIPATASDALYAKKIQEKILQKATRKAF